MEDRKTDVSKSNEKQLNFKTSILIQFRAKNVHT